MKTLNFILLLTAFSVQAAPSLTTLKGLSVGQQISWQTKAKEALDTFELDTDLPLKTNQINLAQWIFHVKKTSLQSIELTKQLRLERDIEPIHTDSLVVGCETYSWRMDINIASKTGQYVYKVMSSTPNAPSLETLSMLDSVSNASMTHSLACSQ